MGERDLVVALEVRGIRVLAFSGYNTPQTAQVELARADGLGVTVITPLDARDRIEAGTIDRLADDIALRVARALV